MNFPKNPPLLLALPPVTLPPPTERLVPTVTRRVPTLVSTRLVSGKSNVIVIARSTDEQTCRLQRFPLEARTLASHFGSRFRTSFGGQVLSSFVTPIPLIRESPPVLLRQLDFPNEVQGLHFLSSVVYSRAWDEGLKFPAKPWRRFGMEEWVTSSTESDRLPSSYPTLIFPARNRQYDPNSPARMHSPVYLGSRRSLSGQVRYG